MPGILWRVLIAVITLVIVFALIPPLLRILGLGISADVLLVVKVCVAGLALFYIISGWAWPPSRTP